jgi:hypothetical protein
MKDYLRQLVEKISDNNLARCVVREYLQARLLESLQDGGAFTSWAFMGGTALRFLYSMPRFSEDIDFSLTIAGIEDNFSGLMERAKAHLLAEDYSVAIKAKAEKTVKSAFIKIEGLLYELDISPHRSEIISIKAEIDTNPPAGAVFETSVVRRHCLLNVQHYDKASLLAGKLHALLTRKYVKGRDVYDLMWYLSDRTWPGPNIVLLNNALRQTGWQGPEITESNWRKYVTEAVSGFDWSKVVADVRPFIERQQDIELLNKGTTIKLLGA